MLTKNTLMRLLTLLLLVISQFTFVTAAAQERESQPNADERTFQESVSARTGFPIFDEEIVDLKRIEALLSKGISAEIKADALARAAAHGDVELLQLLIRKGADVNYVDDQGQTVLMLAAARGIYSQCGNDPLLYSYRGNTEEVKSLLAAGARVNDVDHDGNTALMLAAEYARIDSVKLLLDGGSDVHLQNKYGWTALIYAANSSGNFDRANMKEIVEALIAGGSDLNVRDEQGKTALTYAVPSTAIREMLICAGAIE
jgi:Ankyrin repeats (3 copies)/Ankyrin repeat